MVQLKYILSLLLFAFLVENSNAQNFNFDPQSCDSRLRNDVGALAHDSMMGREAGTQWEYKARDFLVTEFQNAGLIPYFENDSFLQKFDFKDGADYTDGTELAVDGKHFQLENDFFPLSKSANGKVSGSTVNVGFGLISPDGKINDYKELKDLEGKVFIIEISVPGGAENYSKFSEFANIDAKIENAHKKGAKAIIFINSDPKFDDPRNMISNRRERTTIPVVFVLGSKANLFKYKKDVSVFLKVNIKKITKTGYNIIGFIDNGAKSSIIIGAHYDHLGMGGETSRYKGKPAIHNGADDNASGTAAILELARYFKENRIMNYNLIFMSFSAEEKGLFGSAHFVKSKHFDTEKIAAMLNFDMIGRLDTSKRSLNLIGTGTALEWDSIIKITDNVGLIIKKSKSGISGSDQMSFYLHKVPVLFFFTGLHTDYHTPNDDIELINFAGISDITKYGINIVNTIDEFDKISYNKTKDMSRGNGRSYRSGITLGIVPDFGSEEEGLGIQAVLDDKPAAKAGLQSGDIIIQLGEVIIKDIQDYMKALQTFKKGDTANVVVLREGKKLKMNLQF